MRQWKWGLLAVFLAAPGIRAEDKPKEPPKPRDQYNALVKEHQDLMQGYFKAASAAKTEEERRKAMEKMPNAEEYAKKFLDLAQKNSKDPVALDALLWIVSNSRGRGAAAAQKMALDQLSKDHITSDKLAAVCQAVGNAMSKENDVFLKAVLAKNPHKDVRAEAAMALAQGQMQRSMIAQRLKSDPELAKRVVEFYSQELADELLSTDAAKMEADAEATFREVAEKYLSDMKVDRIASMCQQLGFSASKSGETLLRAILEKDTRKEARGPACIALAGILRQRGDQEAETNPKAAESARAEAKKLLKRCQDEFATIPSGFRGTIGEKAKGDLYEIENLSIGLVAPKVEGIDQDGKKFALSDYKGKVVFLDFWSQF